MRITVTSVLAFLSVVAVSILLAGAASTLALGRATIGLLNIDLAASIRADYSVDPAGIRLAPLDEGIIEEVREDEANLQRRDDNPSPAAGLPTAATPTPSLDNTPYPGTATPTPTPTPRATPSPTPLITPLPTATLIPTPTPVPALPATFYLNNTPSPTTCLTPGQGSTSHATLPAGVVKPVAVTLCNYDTDRDLFPGLVIARGGWGADEADPTKYQTWRTSALLTPLKIEGKVQVDLWSATKGFQSNQRGAVTVYLREFDGSKSATLAEASLDLANWQGGALTWTQKSFILDAGSRSIAAGHRLELKVIVRPESAADMWFAYDTLSYPSSVKINQ